MNTIKVKRLLRQAGIKQKDIAKQLGISPQQVSMVVHGKRPQHSVVKAIAEAVNRPVADLWPEEED
jgi:transcriptional regulator with XRE-family HTH domain